MLSCVRRVGLMADRPRTIIAINYNCEANLHVRGYKFGIGGCGGEGSNVYGVMQ